MLFRKCLSQALRVDHRDRESIANDAGRNELRCKD